MDVFVAARAFEGCQAVSVCLSALGGRLAVPVLQQKALPADLHGVRVHFQYLRERDKLVHKLLSDHLLDDVLWMTQKETWRKSVHRRNRGRASLEEELVLAGAPEHS